MASTADLASLRVAVDEVERHVLSLQRRCGDSRGLRRVADDVRRLREDLEDIGPLSHGAQGQPLMTVPDDEGAPEIGGDDEGLGGTWSSRGGRR